MAISRMLNAIWAQITARGMIIKIATNTYNPSPGTTVGSGSSNNQGLAAITGPTPFVTVDHNGISTDMPSSTALASAKNYNLTPLDDNSGANHVVRQYGDLYFYNDGNIIQWGGNGKNFNFGNNYEEGHSWAGQSCVYNGETFPIPVGALSTFYNSSPLPQGVNLPTADLSEWEWLGGDVSKSWGNEYSFSFGRSYEWNGGPDNYVDAWGNIGPALADVMKGKHCTFSYGTGYEESLIEWNNDSWFHADDPGSPYKNLNDHWQSSYLGTTWQAVNLLVSKAFGPTYDYHYGPGLDIQEGPSEERVYGNSWSTVVGDSTESVTGNSSSTVTGNSNDTVNGNSVETVNGNATSMTKGNSVEQYWGGQAEFFMGGKSEMNLAACDEVSLSAKVEITVGAALEIFLGFKTEIGTAGSLEFELGPKLELVPSDAKLEALTERVRFLEASDVEFTELNVLAAGLSISL